MKKISKNIILASSALAVSSLPLGLAVSCTFSNKITYDFGLSTNPINSLNYLKHKDTGTIVPALVEGAFKNGTSNQVLLTKLGIPKFGLSIFDQENDVFYNNAYALESQGFSAAMAMDAESGRVPFMSRGSLYDFEQVAIQIRSDSYWTSGDDSWNGKEEKNKVRPKDFVDSAKYVLDLNTGSQQIIDFLELGIQNSQEIVDAQKEYIAQFGKPYENPWGYPNVRSVATGEILVPWGSQATGDEEYVQNIKTAAEGFGLYTIKTAPSENLVRDNNVKGESFEIHNSSDTSWIKKQQLAQGAIVRDSDFHEEDWLIYQFDQDNKADVNTILNGLERGYMLPINRDFVESHGGIQKFGSDREHFAWNGPFNPSTIELGPQGYIMLEKDPEYYSAERTVSDRIKIFFQPDPVINASMFDDGYISNTVIPTVYQDKFWADPETRPYMYKMSGYGTIGLQLNTDPSTGANPALSDANFRKALWYAIDREQMLRAAGWESSFPVTTWSAFGQAKDNSGVPIEIYFDDEAFHPVADSSSPFYTPQLPDGSTNPQGLPIQSYPWNVHNAKQYSFEYVNRTDMGHNIALARHFMDLYKQDHPDQSSVTLNYIYGGDKSALDSGVFIQSMFRQVFDGYVNVEIKGYPSNIFEDYRNQGNFDLIFYNFDSYGQEADSYVKRFFTKDAVDREHGKTTGYRDNPSGSWTYEEFFNKFANANDAQAKRNQLNISEAYWNKAEELSRAKQGETVSEHNSRISNFFGLGDTSKLGGVDWTVDGNVIEMVSVLEKIIHDEAPVIPLMEVDTNWQINRIAGCDSLYTYSLQYAYDVTNKPDITLPGKEALT